MSLPEHRMCECSDPGCPACKGECDRTASATLWRIDMEDETGTSMCDECTCDALDSGVFTTTDPDECPECGEEMDKDCFGAMRCPECDEPCPGCYDGGGPS